MEVFEVQPEQGEERLDLFLGQLYPDKSRSALQKLIREKQVTLNREEVKKTGVIVHPGDLVSVEWPETQESRILPEAIPLSVLYEDDQLLVVNKPKGMVVHPAPGHFSGTLVNALMYHCRDSLSGINGEIRPGIVHRIDKDTTGSLIVCKTDLAHQSIAAQLKDHSIKRKYVGIVCGNRLPEEGRIEFPIGRDKKNRKRMAKDPEGRNAITTYRVLERFPGMAYLEFTLLTGRTHQIRVHMADLGYPLFGDGLYGKEEKGFIGQTLHAETIGFLHPVTGEYMEFHAPLPDYFEELLEKLRKS